jgi:S-adenosylmethionine synthetase
MAQHFGRKDFIFTSESVSEGHPDKICDQISDALLDRFIGENPEARVAVETLATTNRVVIAGEYRGVNVTKDEQIQITRNVIKDIGYEQEGFDWRKANIEVLLHQQSADIAMGVDGGSEKDEGAGDQGIMFGFACAETETFMPAPIYYSHRILHALSRARRAGKEPLLRPDAKSQVSLRYVDGKPVGASSVVVSTQHAPEASQEELREIVRRYATEVLPAGWMPAEHEFYTNPTGQFIIGGPDGDAGLTGRKIIVDTYGGAAPHGGGAFSGKDPTKVDRSAAYAARYLAKNVVAAGLAERCTIQLSYAIGISHPISVYLTTQGTGKVDDRALEKLLPELVNLTPRGIRKHLALNRPIYQRTASYGHFGREAEADGGFSWEKTDLVDALRGHFGADAKTKQRA